MTTMGDGTSVATSLMATDMRAHVQSGASLGRIDACARVHIVALSETP